MSDAAEILDEAAGDEAEKPAKVKKKKLVEPPARHEADRRYEIVEVHRSEIKNADYNPRLITNEARKKLRAAIEKVGLLSPITWNRTTGNVVGGHQRLRVLDAIHSSHNYLLRVAAVEMTEAEEKNANLLLNNEEAQGEWDVDKLGEMLKMPDLDMSAAGFDAADIFRIIGDQSSDIVLGEVSERLHKLKEADKAVRDADQDKHSTHYYLVVVFRDEEDRLRFTKKLGLPDNRYQDGRKLWAAMAAQPGGSVSGLAMSDDGAVDG